MLSNENCNNADQMQARENRIIQRRLTKLAEPRHALHRRRQLRALTSKTNHKAALGLSPQSIVNATKAHTTSPASPFARIFGAPNEGIDLFLDTQVIDTTTCTPATNFDLDLWHCNATGVYSGIVAERNGNHQDESNQNQTFGRGSQYTNIEGMVQFTTKFRGHYTGRATHIHVKTTTHGFNGSSVVNVGQLFFDRDLVEAVEATAPHSHNKAIMTPNCVDKYYLELSEGGFDPLVTYVYPGDTVEEGIFAWITIGVNRTLVTPTEVNQDTTDSTTKPTVSGTEAAVPTTKDRNATLHTDECRREATAECRVFDSLFHGECSDLDDDSLQISTKEKPTTTVRTHEQCVEQSIECIGRSTYPHPSLLPIV